MYSQYQVGNVQSRAVLFVSLYTIQYIVSEYALHLSANIVAFLRQYSVAQQSGAVVIHQFQKGNSKMYYKRNRLMPVDKVQSTSRLGTRHRHILWLRCAECRVLVPRWKRGNLCLSLILI